MSVNEIIFVCFFFYLKNFNIILLPKESLFSINIIFFRVFLDSRYEEFLKCEDFKMFSFSLYFL